jgi:CRISPR-associated endonuclease/helicase Cas3
MASGHDADAMTATYLHFWGKARPASADGPRWHPNAYHALDVAAAAQAVLERGVSRPPAPWDGQDHVAAIAALIGLHDLGKFSRPFQAKAPDHWPPHLGRISGHVDPGHGAVGLSLLTGALGDLIAPLLPGWSGAERAMLLGAVCGHHGRPVTTHEVLSRDIVCGQCVEAARGFTIALLDVLRPAPLPVLTHDPDPSLIWWLAGL